MLSGMVITIDADGQVSVNDHVLTADSSSIVAMTTATTMIITTIDATTADGMHTDDML